MKAILVLDEMPEDCWMCPSYKYLYGRHECHIKMRTLTDNDKQGRPIWCPLRPMPEEKEFCFWDDGYSNGWNAALREIGGCEDNGNAHIYYEDDCLSPDR